MRGSTAIATCTLLALALSGCAGTDAPTETAGPAATAATTVDPTGLDEGTAAACTVAERAVLNSDGYDLDVFSARAIVATARTSRSSLITTSASALQYSVSRAEGAAGEPDEPTMLAEVTSAILKFRTVCRDTKALKSSIVVPKSGGAGASADANEPVDRSAG